MGLSRIIQVDTKLSHGEQVTSILQKPIRLTILQLLAATQRHGKDVSIGYFWYNIQKHKITKQSTWEFKDTFLNVLNDWNPELQLERFRHLHVMFQRKFFKRFPL